jgi:outer membrane biosynthesis protein TonB
MKYAGKIFLIVAFSIALQGCAKKVKTKPAPTSQAPTTTTDQTGAMYPPPFPEKTVEQPPTLPAPTQAAASPPPKPAPQKKPGTKKKPSTTASKTKPSAAKPATTPATGATTDTTAKPAATGTVAAGTPAAPVQQAESVEPTAVSPIGQLSSGDTGSGTQKRRETSDLITNTEQGLNGIKRTLTDQEQVTATQIRTLLKQAKQALTVDDVDGASTLATKAKVLLEELTKP